MQELLLYITLTVSVLTIVMLVGIVLRAEQRLDLSFKFILYAAVVFTISVLIDLLVIAEIIPAWSWNTGFKLVFIIFLALGVWEMRTLVRRADGELKKKR